MQLRMFQGFMEQVHNDYTDSTNSRRCLELMQFAPHKRGFKLLKLSADRHFHLQALEHHGLTGPCYIYRQSILFLPPLPYPITRPCPCSQLRPHTLAACAASTSAVMVAAMSKTTSSTGPRWSSYRLEVLLNICTFPPLAFVGARRGIPKGGTLAVSA